MFSRSLLLPLALNPPLFSSIGLIKFSFFFVLLFLLLVSFIGWFVFQEVPEFTLRSVQVIVFDEADRLFEMGFAEQLREIMRSVPEERQSLLFSATMPKQLVQFARAGLKDPVLIRLDTESKISTELRCVHSSGGVLCDLALVVNRALL